MYRDREIGKYSIAVLFGFMGLSAFSSFWSVYFESLGMSKTTIGYVYAIFYLIGGIIIPFCSNISSNPRLLQKMMPYFFCSAGLMSAFFVFEKSTVGIFVIVILFAITRVPGLSLLDSQITIFCNHKNIVYSDIRIYGTIGYIIITMLGGVIIDNFGYDVIFWIGAVVYLLSFLTMKRFKKIEVDIGSDGTDRGNIKQLLGNKKYLLFLIGQLFTCGIFFASESFYPMYLTSRGVSVSVIGTMLSLNLFLEVTTMLIARKLPSKINSILGQIYIAIAMIVRGVCYVLNMPVGIIYALTLLHGFQNGCYVVFSMRYINQICEEKNIALANQINTMLICFVCAVASFFGGKLIDMFSFQFLFASFGVVALFGIVLIFILSKKIYLSIFFTQQKNQ